MVTPVVLPQPPSIYFRISSMAPSKRIVGGALKHRACLWRGGRIRQLLTRQQLQPVDRMSGYYSWLGMSVDVSDVGKVDMTELPSIPIEGFTLEQYLQYQSWCLEMQIIATHFHEWKTAKQ